ncbi:hypothetical protein N8T08_009266 [Aspergillus melleus]|uniref:Uncharacterized protein n=1 Tax=Aspergillus melleus TaxID=138277 RepID=A0ACC3AUE9_9EURO|nr:hypothetical protein N8T08_009266 [Aspergillus melleus]
MSNSNSNSKSPPVQPSHYDAFTLDLVLRVLNRTLLHPWVAWVLVLCLRAQVTPYSDPAFLIATGYATILTALTALRFLNRRVAYGGPRSVDPSHEVVIVTGGASGLGLLIARVYGLRGASVAVLDVKDEEKLKGCLGECPGVDYYRCDIGVREEVEGVARRIEKELGSPTVLVNCAAARINGQSLLSLSADAFQKTLQTNLLAVFHTCQVFVPRMLANPTGGTVVNVSSVLGQLCAAGLADYSVSKAGLSALHRTLEAELRRSGDDGKVKLVLVETGQLATPLFESVQTPNSFFAPVLEPVHVAQEIVSAIDKGHAGVIRMPTFASLVNWYAVLPASLQRFARFLSGIDHAVAQGSSVAGSVK